MFRSPHPPQHTKSFDIHNRILQFDSQHVLHKNDTWKGDRYVCVFFNKEMNYKHSTRCKRSVRLRRIPPSNTFTWLTPPYPNEEPDQQCETIKEKAMQHISGNTVGRPSSISHLRKHLLQVLQKTHFPEDRTSVFKPHSKYGDTRGTFISLGVTQSRKPRTLRKSRGLYTRKTHSPNNIKYRLLFQAVSEYVNAMHPHLFGTADHNKFHACIIAKNSRCEWHRDAGNVGPCAITGLGLYEGGDLLVEWSSSSCEKTSCNRGDP